MFESLKGALVNVFGYPKSEENVRHVTGITAEMARRTPYGEDEMMNRRIAQVERELEQERQEMIRHTLEQERRREANRATLASRDAT